MKVRTPRHQGLVEVAPPAGALRAEEAVRAAELEAVREGGLLLAVEAGNAEELVPSGRRAGQLAQKQNT